MSESESEDQKEARLDALYRERMRQQIRDRIAREGFEIRDSGPDEGDTCQYGARHKVRNRWVDEPCGEPALFKPKFAGPDNPAGVEVPLCRRCLGKIARELVDMLSY